MIGYLRTRVRKQPIIALYFGGELCLPAEIAGQKIMIRTVIVQSDISLVLSRNAMKTGSVKMDLEKDTATIFGKEVTLNLTTSGHYSVPIKRRRKELVTKVLYAGKGKTINKCNTQQEKKTEDSPE